jgi:drug/metabolite transporter (DMT)-like permease
MTSRRSIFQIPILIFGVFCCGGAVIMIKASRMPSIVLAAGRLLGAVVVLSPLYAQEVRRYRLVYRFKHVLMTLLPAVMLAVHFVLWIVGARMTPAANSTLIVNLVPVVMPLLMLSQVHERLTRTELLATVVAMAGVFILSGADFKLSRTYFWGDCLCFAAMVTFAVYLMLARRNNSTFPGLWLYVVPLYAFAGILCLTAATIVTDPWHGWNAREAGLVALLVFVPTVCGHTILNYSMRHMRGQVVSIINMAQFVFAGVLAYVLFGEVPTGTFYLAGAMIVGGSVLVVNQSVRRKPADSSADEPIAERPVEPSSEILVD